MFNTTAEAFAALNDNAMSLREADRSFAFSLIEAYERATSRGYQVSPKQAHWIVELAKRATAPKAEAPVPTSIGDLRGVYELFMTARVNHIKFPKIVIDSPVGEIKLSVAGATARVPGSINVVEAGAAFGEAKYYGRIRQEGVFEGRSAPAELVDYLREFARNPAEVAAIHGRKTGNCCFCGRELTEKGSVEVGFGPICAQNWGLHHPQNEGKAKAA